MERGFSSSLRSRGLFTLQGQFPVFDGFLALGVKVFNLVVFAASTIQPIRASISMESILELNNLQQISLVAPILPTSSGMSYEDTFKNGVECCDVLVVVLRVMLVLPPFRMCVARPHIYRAGYFLFMIFLGAVVPISQTIPIIRLWSKHPDQPPMIRVFFLSLILELISALFVFTLGASQLLTLTTNRHNLSLLYEHRHQIDRAKRRDGHAMAIIFVLCSGIQVLRYMPARHQFSTFILLINIMLSILMFFILYASSYVVHLLCSSHHSDLCDLIKRIESGAPFISPEDFWVNYRKIRDEIHESAKQWQLYVATILMLFASTLLAAISNQILTSDRLVWEPFLTVLQIAPGLFFSLFAQYRVNNAADQQLTAAIADSEQFSVQQRHSIIAIINSSTAQFRVFGVIISQSFIVQIIAGSGAALLPLLLNFFK